MTVITPPSNSPTIISIAVNDETGIAVKWTEMTDPYLDSYELVVVEQQTQGEVGHHMNDQHISTNTYCCISFIFSDSHSTDNDLNHTDI